LTIDTQKLDGPDVSAVILTRSNGSSSQLFFEPLPEWMGEVPLDWATLGEVRGNIEVYRQDLQSLDLVKAICDSTGDHTSSFYGFFKGYENNCTFQYSRNITTIITNQSLISETEKGGLVIIEGTGFLLNGNNSLTSLKVSIDNQQCLLFILLWSGHN
jgi:hypothetical protein